VKDASKKQKRDIFKVAALLRAALFTTRPYWKSFYDDEPWVQQVDNALAAYREYWEED